MKSHYYVYRADESRGPKIKHATLKDAQTEAERLANQHPGSVFEILQCLAITRCTQASTFWMDGAEPESPTGELASDTFPPLPVGWAFACEGGMKVPSSTGYSMDIARWDEGYEDGWDTTGWDGSLGWGYHAVRVGSEIAKLNGIGEEPPEKPRYRMLELGEIIEDGDEFDCVRDGNWQPFVLLVGSKLATIGQPARRPL